MPFSQVVPPHGMIDGSGRGLAFFVSDLHLGNVRPTNEMLTSQPGFARIRAKLLALLRWLGHVGPTVAVSEAGISLPDGQDPPKIDIVFVGDIFDFWKAIPAALPHADPAGWTTAGTVMWSTADYVQRFQEILDYNTELMKLLAQLVGIETRAVRLIFLTGNHDDPIEQAAGPWQAMLQQAIAQHGPVPPGSILIGNVYGNKSLHTFAEHGHRYDVQNCYRTDGARTIPSMGQHLVESFLNGMHDFNLGSLGHRWERLISTPAPGTNINGPELRRFMRYLDNYRDDMDGQSALSALAEHSGIPRTETTMLLAAASAVAMMDAEEIGLPGQLSYDIQFIWTHLTSALFRKEGTGNDNNLWTGARRLLGKSLSMLPQLLPVPWATIAGLPASGLFAGGSAGTPIQLVVMGHTHRPDAIPAMSSGPSPSWQYINTGTFVDMLQFQTAHPLTPLSVGSDVVLMVDVIPIGGVNHLRVHTWGGGIDGTRTFKMVTTTFPEPTQNGPWP